MLDMINTFAKTINDIFEKWASVVGSFLQGKSVMFNNLFLVMVAAFSFIMLMIAIFAIPGKKKKEKEKA